jgi:hypothetical protein
LKMLHQHHPDSQLRLTRLVKHINMKYRNKRFIQIHVDKTQRVLSLVMKQKQRGMKGTMSR